METLVAVAVGNLRRCQVGLRRREIRGRRDILSLSEKLCGPRALRLSRIIGERIPHLDLAWGDRFGPDLTEVGAENIMLAA